MFPISELAKTHHALTCVHFKGRKVTEHCPSLGTSALGLPARQVLYNQAVAGLAIVGDGDVNKPRGIAESIDMKLVLVSTTGHNVLSPHRELLLFTKCNSGA